MNLYPIVGAHYRPPAKAILQSLPGGCELELVPEPTNEFDCFAVKVVVLTKNIELDDNLEVLADPYGFSLQEIGEAEEWHLGYIPRTESEGVSGRLHGERGRGTLAFDVKGKPQIATEV
jgi:hypothetical protein